MEYFCQYADLVFYSAMGFLIVLFVVAMSVINIKFKDDRGWPEPPKRKGERELEQTLE